MGSGIKIGVIGVGKMGGAIARGLKDDFEILVYDKAGVPHDLSQIIHPPHTISSECDIIIIAVKPRDIYDVLSDISHALGTKLVVSVAAGVRSDILRRYVRRWARVMPSITAEQKEGVFAIMAENEEDTKLLERIFGKMGKTFVVKTDEEIDIFTATAASGPGYLAPIFEAFEDAIVRAGLPRSMAREIAAQTFLGTAKLILNGRKSPSQVKEEVMTPAGTTAEGLTETEKIREHIFSAVEKALKKCREISEKLSK